MIGFTIYIVLTVHWEQMSEYCCDIKWYKVHSLSEITKKWLYIYIAQRLWCWCWLYQLWEKWPIGGSMSISCLFPWAAFNLLCGGTHIEGQGPGPAHLLECEMSICTHNKRYATARPALQALLFEPKSSLSEQTGSLWTRSFTLPLLNVHFKDKKFAEVKDQVSTKGFSGRITSWWYVQICVCIYR